MKKRLSRQKSWCTATFGNGSGIWWTKYSSIAVSATPMGAHYGPV